MSTFAMMSRLTQGVTGNTPSGGEASLNYRGSSEGLIPWGSGLRLIPPKVVLLPLDLDSRLQEAVKTRRTFAIISHPDAGKTTLTEKLLLYGGAIHLAGSVKSRPAARHATSDW